MSAVSITGRAFSNFENFFFAGSDLYGKIIDGAKEIWPHLSHLQRFLFGFVFYAAKTYNVYAGLGT